MNARLDVEDVHEALHGATGVILLIGDLDTGKTTLFKRLGDRFAEAGQVPALVDADVGQSTVGPPTTVGMSVLRGGLPDEIVPDALYFAGDTNPVMRMVQVLTGTALMVRAAAQAGADPIIVDTGGLVKPPFGHVLKYHKCELLQPARAVLLERETELAPLRAWLSCMPGLDLTCAQASERARRTSVLQRKRYREAQYRRYFADAVEIVIPRAGLCLYPPAFADSGSAAGLVVGIQDETWRTVAIGILERADDEALYLLAPPMVEGRIFGLIAGSLRLSRRGDELGHVDARALLL